MSLPALLHTNPVVNILPIAANKPSFIAIAMQAMLNRMNFVKQIAEDQHVDVLILGAWGAGAFGYDAKEVAQMLHKVFTTPTSIKTVIYAVIGDKRSNNAVKVFKDIFK